MALVCSNCGTHFKPQTKHMRYIRGDQVRCPARCGSTVVIVNNIIPEQDGEIINIDFKMVDQAIDKRIR